VLLDPLEEQFNLLAVSVEIRHRLRWNGEVVGQEVERVAGQRNGPSASNTTGFIPGMRVATPVFGIGLGADDEETPYSVAT